MKRTVTEISFGVKEPDSDCKFCQGSGYWKGNRSFSCVCRVDFNKKKEVKKDVEVIVKPTKDGGVKVTLG